ncbi:precorrin-6y C5,15-methyltransferase (decarboxylating) subunit CbiE [Amaricoccus tamworthensis]|uniref:precorrin-6y C5,15-methyltransferase (decarboxylating) subunit CbiE n=1 Tax=Amaricoccus tamworthensis TaxID=57002 RepID=UPI003C7D7C44
MTAWLDIIGIGEDGLDGLHPATLTRLQTAEVIIGGARHHDLTEGFSAERIKWPSPFCALVDEIKSWRGRRVCVLVTGDPLWFSAGAIIGRALEPGEVTFHPQISAFQFAAARMGWSLADLETVTVHGRPAEQILAGFYPNARLLILTRDGDTPAEIAKLLTDNGFGRSRMTVLGALGGPNETRIDGIAATWDATSPDFHTLAVECIAEPGARLLPLTGLPDDAFEHDGRMTKREVRAITLASLDPRRGGMLWDIGCGCGSVSVEWMRAGRDARAIGLEPRADRRAMAATNATRLGAPALKLIDTTAPDGLADLPAPDAIFIGGGLTAETVDIALNALSPGGRLVANAVTLESETILMDLHARHGGELSRIAVSRAKPVGGYRGWRPMMPVTQWVKTV